MGPQVIAHYRINGKLGESVMARRIAGRSFGNANLAQNALWRWLLPCRPAFTDVFSTCS